MYAVVKQKRKKMTGEVIGESSRKWRNWYHNEVDEEIKGVDSRDKLKHNEWSDQLF